MPAQQDVWWDVDEAISVSVLGEGFADALQRYALPWFEGLATKRDLMQAVEHSAGMLLGVYSRQAPLVIAILAAEGGDVLRAPAILDGTLVGAPGKPFTFAARRVAERFGLSLPLQNP